MVQTVKMVKLVKNVQNGQNAKYIKSSTGACRWVVLLGCEGMIPCLLLPSFHMNGGLIEVVAQNTLYKVVVNFSMRRLF